MIQKISDIAVFFSYITQYLGYMKLLYPDREWGK